MGVGSLGQPEVSPNTQYKEGHHPVSLWPQDLAKVLAAPPGGVSCLQFHHLSSNPPSLQKSMINFEYKFGHRSPPLSMIHSLPQLEGKTQFFSMDQKAFHDPTLHLVSCHCPMFAHIPAIPNHLHFPSPVPLTLPLCHCKCFPFIWNALPSHLTGLTLFPV